MRTGILTGKLGRANTVVPSMTSADDTEGRLGRVMGRYLRPYKNDVKRRVT